MRRKQCRNPRQKWKSKNSRIKKKIKASPEEIRNKKKRKQVNRIIGRINLTWQFGNNSTHIACIMRPLRQCYLYLLIFSTIYMIMIGYNVEVMFILLNLFFFLLFGNSLCSLMSIFTFRLSEEGKIVRQWTGRLRYKARKWDILNVLMGDKLLHVVFFSIVVIFLSLSLYSF